MGAGGGNEGVSKDPWKSPRQERENENWPGPSREAGLGQQPS